jgi:hypothetical protein
MTSREYMFGKEKHCSRRVIGRKKVTLETLE